MFSHMEEFLRLSNSNLLYSSNNSFTKTIRKFAFHLVTKDNYLNLQLKNKSQIMVLDNFMNSNRQYFVLCLDNVLLIFLANDLSLFNNFFDDNKNSTLFSLSTKSTGLFYENINKNSIGSKKYNIIEIDTIFEEEINSFIEKLQIFDINKKIIPFWKLIQRCFYGFLIKKSYQNSKIDRFHLCKETIENEVSKVPIQEKDYIDLRNLPQGSSSTIKLLYHIKKEQLIVLKMFYQFNIKLFEREEKNYLNFHHPFLPKYFGSNVNRSDHYLFVEYIDGYSLNDIKKLNATLNEKMKFIFELMIILDYFHQNNHIYRDLKPNNIFINKNRVLKLIDLDRLILNDKKLTSCEETMIFIDLLAPEINLRKPFSFETDIYSLGILIYYIFFEKMPIKRQKNDYFEYNFDDISN